MTDLNANTLSKWDIVLDFFSYVTGKRYLDARFYMDNVSVRGQKGRKPAF